jgi:hypothetical protein
MSMAEAKTGRLFGYHYFRITTDLDKLIGSLGFCV